MISEAVYYNEGRNNYENQGQKSEKEVKLSTNMTGNSCTNGSSVSAHERILDSDNVYLNENIDGKQIPIANTRAVTGTRKRNTNETRENCDHESYYNDLVTTDLEHVYSDIDISDGNKDMYYNMCGI